MPGRPARDFAAAPYAANLPDGRVITTRRHVRVWVGDTSAHGFIEQEQPFAGGQNIFPFIEAISDDTIMVGTGPGNDGSSFLHLRTGHIGP